MAVDRGIGSHYQLVVRLGESPAEQFDVVVVAIGVNDVIAGRRTGDWTKALSQLTCLLKDGFDSQHIVLSPLPPMHHFSALPQPLRWCIGLRARRFNYVLSQFAQRESRCQIVSLEYPTKAGFLATDGFHPGEPAYAYWASRLAAEIRQLHIDRQQTKQALGA